MAKVNFNLQYVLGEIKAEVSNAFFSQVAKIMSGNASRKDATVTTKSVLVNLLSLLIAPS